MSNENILACLGIAKEREDKISDWMADLVGNKLFSEFKGEADLLKFIVEEAMKQEFTTTELVVATYKLGIVVQVLKPHPDTALMRFIYTVSQENK